MKKQQGVILMYVAAGIFIFGAASAVVYTYNHAINARNKAEADLRIEQDINASMRDEVAQLQIDKEALNKQLVIRKAVSDAIIANNLSETNKINEAGRTHEEVRTWLNSSIPIELINSLRGNTPSKDDDTEGASPTGLVNTRKDTRMERHKAIKQR